MVCRCWRPLVCRLVWRGWIRRRWLRRCRRWLAGGLPPGLPALPGVDPAALAAALPALAAGLPALPAGLPPLPAVPALPAPPPLPGPPPLPALPSRLCTPGFGPIGVCIP
ncbi:hypothetical protein TMFG_02824 [Mycobacterium tuberculosis SUMu006]|nr:hypothetical protein TMFG_02824 [Mycobacterium tuberculosis SUMu006]